jgi:hypothetical protein
MDGIRAVIQRAVLKLIREGITLHIEALLEVMHGRGALRAARAP